MVLYAGRVHALIGLLTLPVCHRTVLAACTCNPSLGTVHAASRLLATAREPSRSALQRLHPVRNLRGFGFSIRRGVHVEQSFFVDRVLPHYETKTLSDKTSLRRKIP